MIPIAMPLLDEDEAGAAREAVLSGWVSQGPQVAAFEREFAALVDAHAVGAPITAFVEVFIEHPRLEPGFIKRVLEMDEVQECHHITGEFSLLLKVRVADMPALQTLLLEQLSGHEGVRQTRTVMVLSTVKEATFVEPTGPGLARAGGEEL